MDSRRATERRSCSSNGVAAFMARSNGEKLGSMRRIAALGIWGALSIACALSTMSCERKMSGDDPPMRPLVYTELPPEERAEEEVAPAAAVINIAPEDLGYTLFHAIVDGDRAAYESMFIRAEALSQLIHMPIIYTRQSWK